jgi:hypothetical protein
MGWRWRTGAAACAVLLAASASPAAAETVTAPIARLFLEGGYDSNVMFAGRGGDTSTQISPELGLRARDHTWDFKGWYAAEFAHYQRFSPSGVWSQRVVATLESRLSPRTDLDGEVRAGYARDPLGLALLGIFRTAEGNVVMGDGAVRASWRATQRIDLAGSFHERLARFGDRSGGAVHSPEMHALWRFTPRFSAGAGYRLSAFQTFLAGGGQENALSQGVEGRLEYVQDRRNRFEATAGVALWTSPTTRGIVPQLGATWLRADPLSDLRVQAWHGLALGVTAAPGLVDSVEFGGSKRFARAWRLEASGGLWRSGVAPTGAHAVLGYAAAGEGSYLFSNGVRAGLAVTRFARLDDPSPTLRRTTVGLRVGWELPER